MFAFRKIKNILVDSRDGINITFNYGFDFIIELRVSEVKETEWNKTVTVICCLPEDLREYERNIISVYPDALYRNPCGTADGDNADGIVYRSWHRLLTSAVHHSVFSSLP